jgi:YVTN family beta-propeller protein
MKPINPLLSAIMFTLIFAIPAQIAVAQITAYVSSNGTKDITTVNTEDLSRGSLTAVGSQKGIAISADGRFLYATESGFLEVIDVPADSSVALIQVGNAAQSVALSPDGKFAYVGNDGSQDVAVVDTKLLAVVTSIPISGKGPKDIVITPDGAFVYVSTSNSVFVTAIQTSTNTVIADIQVGAGPDGLAVTPDGAFVFAAISVTSEVAKIDVSNNTVVSKIGGFSGEPTVLAVTPDGERLYVATNTDSSLTAIHVGPDTVLTRVNAGASNHRGMDITPDGSHVYVTNLNAASVSVIAIGSTTSASSKTADSLVAMVSTTTPPWDVAIGARASGGDPTAAEDLEIPESSFALIGNAPNPFSGATMISYELDVPTEVRIEILDVQGRQVRSLNAGWSESGLHRMDWDGADENGAAAAAGLYVVRMRAGQLAKSMSVMKLK